VTATEWLGAPGEFERGADRGQGVGRRRPGPVLKADNDVARDDGPAGEIRMNQYREAPGPRGIAPARRSEIH
jgi:hypothetical protein